MRLRRAGERDRKVADTGGWHERTIHWMWSELTYTDAQDSAEDQEVYILFFTVLFCLVFLLTISGRLFRTVAVFRDDNPFGVSYFFSIVPLYETVVNKSV